MKLLGSPQAMHAAVCGAFPGSPAVDPADPLAALPAADDAKPGGDSSASAAGRRALWRVDDDDRRAVLYIVSPERPDLTHLVDQAGWPTLPDGWATRDYRPLLQTLATGQRWHFRLAANPTHAVKQGSDRRSKRLGHVTVAQQTDWLIQRSRCRGFDVLPAGGAPSGIDGVERAVVVHHRLVRTFNRKDPADNRRPAPVTLTTAVYDGQLEVVDAGLLRQSLIDGIGPAKAYGCGLMTLAPVRNLG